MQTIFEPSLKFFELEESSTPNCCGESTVLQHLSLSEAATGAGIWWRLLSKCLSKVSQCHIVKLFALEIITIITGNYYNWKLYYKHFRVAFRANLNSNVSMFSF